MDHSGNVSQQEHPKLKGKDGCWVPATSESPRALSSRSNVFASSPRHFPSTSGSESCWYRQKAVEQCPYLTMESVTCSLHTSCHPWKEPSAAPRQKCVDCLGFCLEEKKCGIHAASSSRGKGEGRGREAGSNKAYFPALRSGLCLF